MSANIIYVDPELFEMVPSYIERRKSEFKDISSLLEKKDFIAVRYMGHKIKGNAGLFNLEWLAQKGAELEEAAIQENSPKIMEVAQEAYQFLDQLHFAPLSPQISPSSGT